MFLPAFNAKLNSKQMNRSTTAELLASMATEIAATPTSSITLDGLNSGVPTRTTPTLTPTTLRNIEQTFIELQCQVEPHQNQAGFVPPVVQPPSHSGLFMSLVDTKSWQGGSTTIGESQSSNDSSGTSLRTDTPPPTRRNMGGRRPNRDSNISPEEEERRKVRRERNKLAAARCRKRRLDHTNELIEETEGLEEKKQSLQNEIQSLQVQKEELEYILEAHKACCRLSEPESPQDIKPFSMNANKILLGGGIQVKQEPEMMGAPPTCVKREGGRPRPTSLPVASFTPSRKMLPNEPTSEAAGIPITTPTAGIPFNFESLMDGGTGLTPVSGPLVPSCSSQQRTGCIDLSSPDSVTNKLVSL